MKQMTVTEFTVKVFHNACDYLYCGYKDTITMNVHFNPSLFSIQNMNDTVRQSVKREKLTLKMSSYLSKIKEKKEI